MLEDVSLDPDTPDEAAAIESLEEEEGICEDVDDPTIFQPDTPSTSAAAARSGDPADAPSEPSGPAAPDAYPEATEVPQQPSSDSEVRSPTTIMCNNDDNYEDRIFHSALCLLAPFLLRRTSRVLMASLGTSIS